MSGIELSIFIISYNTRELTLACLRSVYAQTRGISFEVIVLDNNSGDGTSEAIARDFPQVKLLAETQNHGFAQGNNLAASDAQGEYLLMLNPDTVVLDGAIQKLLGFAQAHPLASIFGGRTLFPDQLLNPSSCWRRPTPWSLFCIGTGLTSLFRSSDIFNPEAYAGWNRDSVREVEIVSGCFLLIRRSLWEELGGFDAGFFMYGEEADMCWRATKLGQRCLICPDSQIIHYGGASEIVRADKMVKLFSAKARLFAKHWTSWKRPFGVIMLDFWAFTRMVFYTIVTAVRPRACLSGTTWRSVWSRRNEWHAAARVASVEYLPLGDDSESLLNRRADHRLL